MNHAARAALTCSLLLSLLACGGEKPQPVMAPPPETEAKAPQAPAPGTLVSLLALRSPFGFEAQPGLRGETWIRSSLGLIHKTASTERLVIPAPTLAVRQGRFEVIGKTLLIDWITSRGDLGEYHALYVIDLESGSVAKPPADEPRELVAVSTDGNFLAFSDTRSPDDEDENTSPSALVHVYDKHLRDKRVLQNEHASPYQVDLGVDANHVLVGEKVFDAKGTLKASNPFPPKPGAEVPTDARLLRYDGRDLALFSHAKSFSLVDLATGQVHRAAADCLGGTPFDAVDDESLVIERICERGVMFYRLDKLLEQNGPKPLQPLRFKGYGTDHQLDGKQWLTAYYEQKDPHMIELDLRTLEHKKVAQHREARRALGHGLFARNEGNGECSIDGLALKRDRDLCMATVASDGSSLLVQHHLEFSSYKLPGGELLAHFGALSPEEERAEVNDGPYLNRAPVVEGEILSWNDSDLQLPLEGVHTPDRASVPTPTQELDAELSARWPGVAFRCHQVGERGDEQLIACGFGMQVLHVRRREGKIVRELWARTERAYKGGIDTQASEKAGLSVIWSSNAKHFTHFVLADTNTLAPVHSGVSSRFFMLLTDGNKIQVKGDRAHAEPWLRCLHDDGSLTPAAGCKDQEAKWYR